jgi:DNA-binding transcriptional LysR family regulator
MDIHRLEVFCKVVELQSFTKAAQVVLLSQPTVSEHVRSLEELLGEKLLDRLGREVLPTPAGRILYRYAQSIIRLRAEAVQALEKFKGNMAGHLVIGASTIPGTYILPRCIGAFKAVYPAIQITLKIADTAEIAEGVLSAALEAGLIGSRMKDQRLESTELFSDELLATVYPEHPWASRGAVELAELANEPFILRERGSGTSMVMNRILEEHDFDPARLQVVAEMGSTEAVRQGIKARIGISIISRQAVAEDLERGSLIAVTLGGIRFLRPFYLVQRKHRQSSPLCMAFLEHLQQCNHDVIGG